MSFTPLSIAAAATEDAAVPKDGLPDVDGRPAAEPLMAIQHRAEIAAKTTQFREALKQTAHSYFQLTNLPEIIDGIDLDAIILEAVVQSQDAIERAAIECATDDETNISKHPLFKPTLEKLLWIFITNAKAASEVRDVFAVLKYITLAAAIIPFTQSPITKEITDLYGYVFNRRLEVEGLLDLFIRAKRLLKAVTYISEEALCTQELRYPASYTAVDLTKTAYESFLFGTLIRYAVEAEKEAAGVTDEGQKLAILRKAIAFRRVLLKRDPSDPRTREFLARDLEAIGLQADADEIRNGSPNGPRRKIQPSGLIIGQDEIVKMSTKQLIGKSRSLEDYYWNTPDKSDVAQCIVAINKEIVAREPGNILAGCAIAKFLLVQDKTEEAMPFIETLRAARETNGALQEHVVNSIGNLGKYLMKAELRRLLNGIPTPYEPHGIAIDTGHLIDASKQADTDGNYPMVVRIQAAILKIRSFSLISRTVMSKALAELGYIDEALMLSEQTRALGDDEKVKPATAETVVRLRKILEARKRCAKVLIDELVKNRLMNHAQPLNLKDMPDFKNQADVPADYHNIEAFNPVEYTTQDLLNYAQQARNSNDPNTYFKCQHELLTRGPHRFITYISIAHFLADRGLRELCIRVCELIEELKCIMAPYDAKYDAGIHTLYGRVGFTPAAESHTEP